MKASLLFCLLIVILISCNGSQEDSENIKPPLPCIVCAYHYDPVCAVSLSGVQKTFSNSCEVQSMDCGHSEHRK